MKILLLFIERDVKKLQILEALHIKDNNPSMNKQNPNQFIIPSPKTVRHCYRLKERNSGQSDFG